MRDSEFTVRKLALQTMHNLVVSEKFLLQSFTLAEDIVDVYLESIISETENLNRSLIVGTISAMIINYYKRKTAAFLKVLQEQRFVDEVFKYCAINDYSLLDSCLDFFSTYMSYYNHQGYFDIGVRRLRNSINFNCIY